MAGGGTTAAGGANVKGDLRGSPSELRFTVPPVKVDACLSVDGI